MKRGDSEDIRRSGYGRSKMKKTLFRTLTFLFAVFMSGQVFGQKGEVKVETQGLQADVLIETFFNKRTGDLPEMLKLYQVRVLVVPSRSTYFLDEKGQPRGLDYELLKGWEKILNKERKKGTPPITLIFIPVTLEELGDALLEGRGDIAGITLLTPSRANEFAYATPIFEDIQEVVVTRKGGPDISRLEDLSGLDVHAISGSSQLESLEDLNENFKNKGLAPMKVVQAEPYVADENLLEMVNGGMITAAVVPDAFAKLWSRIFKNLIVHENIPVTSGMKAGWAVRKENPELLAKLNEAIASVLKKNKQAFQRDFNQYFKTTRWIENPFVKGSKYELSEHFQREAAAFGMDWLQLMAQAFQESSLNPEAKSHYGAVGVMQVLPSTAEWLGVMNYNEVDGNIHVGAKYMARLMKRYEKVPEISEDNRFFFALAAYNAGPGRIRKYRKRALELEYDPNKWFGNVERVSLRSGNLETVMYVRNILNYTLAYKSAYEQSLHRTESRK
jgi:membrane-bound lytic murein transglycosylase MltF